MRGLIALLVVANILLVAWWLWSPKPAEPPRAGPIAASPLVLLNEMATPSQSPSDQSVQAFDSPVPSACQTLGPYMDRETAMSTHADLVASGLSATPRSEDASRRLGFWVHTPATPERAQADVLVERLRRAGIRDFYVVADGEYRNAVSLGVFSDETRAMQHADRMRGLGFEVLVGERRREMTAWWLDFQTPAPGSPAATRLRELLQQGGGTLMVQTRPCD